MPIPYSSPPPSSWAEQPPPRPSLEANDISLVSLWRTVLRRRRVFFWVLLLALAGGLYLASRPRVYVATGTLQVRSGSSNRFRFEAASALSGDTGLDDQIESEVSVLQSKSLFTRVAQELQLASNPAVTGKLAATHPSLSDPRVQARVLVAMAHMIKVERVPKTQTINISCTSTDPKLSMQIVGTLMNGYVERIFETQFSSTQRAAKFLTAQLTDLKNQVLGDQQKLVDLQGRLGVVGFDETHNLVTSQLEDLARANEQADIARITAEARYRILQDERPDLVEGGPALLSSTAQPTAGSLLQTLRSSEATLASQYANVSEQFGPNYPETKRLKAQLAEAQGAVNKEQTRVLEQAKIAYEAAQRNQNMTQSALTQAQGNAFQKRNDMVAYEILLHDYQSSRTLYEGLMQRLREAGVVSGLESAEIELIDLPLLPVMPTGYGPLTLIGISLILGAIAAFLLAMLLEALDTAVHSVDDLERYIGLPSFAVLPQFEEGTPGRKSVAFASKRRASPGADFGADLGASPATNPATSPAASPAPAPEVLRAPLSAFTEGIRLLRSSILLAQAGQPPKSLLFTSAMPQEGKSVVCANLACVLAQSGARVLLIDVDLRRPSQHRKFNLPNTRGLSSVLAGATTFAECLQRIPALPNLDILTSGPAAPSPGQLLASEPMHTVLQQGREQYDFVILDSPPGLAISDASTLAGGVDMVLLVVRDGVANRKMVRRVVSLLQRVGANLPGFVFNGVTARSAEYYEYKGQYGLYDYGQYAPAATGTAHEK